MFGRISRLVAISALVLSATATVAGIANGVPAPGTFTKITTPGQTLTIKWTGADKHITVSGRTSRDVTSVDIDCIYLLHAGPFIQHFATGVPVAGGAVHGRCDGIVDYPVSGYGVGRGLGDATFRPLRGRCGR